MEMWNALEPATRKTLGQFFTPAPLARMIASRPALPDGSGVIRVLDPGAGVGSLGAALIERIASERPDASIHLTYVEVDRELLPALERTAHAVREWAADHGVIAAVEIVTQDFIEWVAETADSGTRFELAIMNPPYAKLATASDHRARTSSIACEVTNLYAAFVAIGLQTLTDGGGLVAITPRSFANGPYFRRFRAYIDQMAVFENVDLFESRSTLFADTSVLQENLVYTLRRGDARAGAVEVRHHLRGDQIEVSRMAYEHFMPADDPERFIHLRTGARGHEVARRMHGLPATIADAGVTCSTGRVVDFRSREHLESMPTENSVPLIYPQHLRGGRVTWPIEGGKKANALRVDDATHSLLMPAGHYVAIKRFTSKEEKRRIVATWIPASALPGDAIAFENHLNILHAGGSGLDRDLAVGLTVHLGSRLVDDYFRQFSGHTQVNATDVRMLRTPDAASLRRIGAKVVDPDTLTELEIDELVADSELIS